MRRTPLDVEIRPHPLAHWKSLMPLARTGQSIHGIWCIKTSPLMALGGELPAQPPITMSNSKMRASIDRPYLMSTGALSLRTKGEARRAIRSPNGHPTITVRPPVGRNHDGPCNALPDRLAHCTNRSRRHWHFCGTAARRPILDSARRPPFAHTTYPTFAYRAGARPAF